MKKLHPFFSSETIIEIPGADGAPIRISTTNGRGDRFLRDVRVVPGDIRGWVIRATSENADHYVKDIACPFYARRRVGYLTWRTRRQAIAALPLVLAALAVAAAKRVGEVAA